MRTVIFDNLDMREAFKYGNKYYRKVGIDSAIEAVSGKHFKFPREKTVYKDSQTQG